MPLTLTSPLLLAGLAAIGIPVLIHLIVREEPGSRAFPSLMFMRRVPYQARRPRTLRDPALLTIRCLAIALLVLAFAGPERLRAPERAALSTWSKESVLLLDRSYSMSPPVRWQAAADAAQQWIDRMSSGERMAIVAFDEQASLIAPMLEDRTLLRSHLQRLEAGSKGTRLGAAFELATRLLAESSAGERQILLISDLQRSALEKIDRLILDRNISLQVSPVDAGVERNAAIVSASLFRTDDGAHALKIRLRNTGTAPLMDMQLAVEIEGRMNGQRRVDLLPREEKTLLVPVVPALDRALAGRILTGPDQIAADNEYHLVMMPDEPVELALLLPDDSTFTAGSRLFIEEAARLSENPPIRTTGFSAGADLIDALSRSDVVILDTAVPIEDTLADRLEQYVKEGGSLLILMGNASTDTEGDSVSGVPADWSFLHGTGALRRFRGSGAGILLPPDPDRHPLWRNSGREIAAALANTRIRIAREFDIQQSTNASRVLAQLTSGEPWLIEQTPGSGRLLIMTTGLSSLWSNLALESGFVPFLHEAMRYLGRRTATALANTPGDVIDPGRLAANLPGGSDWDRYLRAGGSMIVELPDGGRRRLATAERLYQSAQSGLHQVHRADGRPPSLMFAVNPDADESLLAAASPAALEKRILRRAAPKPQATTPGDMDGGNASPPLGWYLLGFAALLLWLEAQLANRLSRRPPRSGIL